MGIFRQFPYSNFHEMNLDEIIKVIKNMLEEWARYYSEWDDWKEQVQHEWDEMVIYINNYFDNLDVQEEINNKIVAMVNSGEFGTIVQPYIPPEVASWLAAHITQPVGVVIDTSLTVSGACADAKVTGDYIFDILNDLDYSYIGFRRYLDSNDDLFTLDVGVYGISSIEENKPDNMPADFVNTHNGFAIVFENESSSAKVIMCVDAYAKNIFFRTGYDWIEMARLDVTNDLITTAINNLGAYMHTYFTPDLLNIAQNSYYEDTEISTNYTQFKFIDNNGIGSVGEAYEDWYVSDEITIDPFEFYYITASARSASHYLYAIYDADGNILDYEAATSWTIVSVTDKLIFTPYNAAKIRLATVNGTAACKLYNAGKKSYTKYWSGLKWACMGDSLTAVNATASIKYHDLIADKTGINVVNLGAGGTGYKKSYNGISGFVDRTDTIPLDSDVVTIFGSGNDGSFTIGDPSDTGTTTLCGCINTTIERIFTRIPTCKLGIITPTPWYAYVPSDDTNWMYRYSNAIEQICKNWGVPCLNLYFCSNLRPWDDDFKDIAYANADGVHPNNMGHEIFAPRIEAFLDTLLMH